MWYKISGKKTFLHVLVCMYSTFKYDMVYPVQWYSILQKMLIGIMQHLRAINLLQYSIFDIFAGIRQKNNKALRLCCLRMCLQGNDVKMLLWQEQCV